MKKDLLEAVEVAERINGKKCKKCFGRGYTSWDCKKERYVLCDCLLKATRTAVKQKIKEINEKKTILPEMR